MAERSNSNTGLAFILGALVVVVAGLGYFMLGGDAPNSGNEIVIELPGSN
jgi:hypothetical protein